MSTAWKVGETNEIDWVFMHQFAVTVCSKFIDANDVSKLAVVKQV